MVARNIIKSELQVLIAIITTQEGVEGLKNRCRGLDMPPPNDGLLIDSFGEEGMCAHILKN